jgi:hypothetical protein
MIAGDTTCSFFVFDGGIAGASITDLNFKRMIETARPLSSAPFFHAAGLGFRLIGLWHCVIRRLP